MFDSGFYRLMAEIGLLASGNNMTREALTIFDMLESENIDSEVIVVGRGYSFMNAQQYEQAVTVLTKYCIQHPPGLAHFLLGLSLKRLGLAHQADKMQKQLIESHNQDMAILAEAIKQVH